MMEKINMVYISQIITVMHTRIMADTAARNTLRADLKRCMSTDSNFSLSDARSLHSFILNYYKLPRNTFADVNLVDFIALGKAILGDP